VLRLLAGGALGGLAARPGLADGIMAKAKPKHKRTSQPKRKARGLSFRAGAGLAEAGWRPLAAGRVLRFLEVRRECPRLGKRGQLRRTVVRG